MPRIRQLEAQYRAGDFWKKVDGKAAEHGYKTDTALGAAVGVDPKTIGNNRSGKSGMKVDTMQKLVAALKPDIKVVLLFLGYSEKEIKAFARGCVNQ